MEATHDSCKQLRVQQHKSVICLLRYFGHADTVTVSANPSFHFIFQVLFLSNSPFKRNLYHSHSNTTFSHLRGPKTEALSKTCMGGCQNYDPFLVTLNIRCRIIIGIQKGTIIFTTRHTSLLKNVLQSPRGLQSCL